MSDAEPRNSKEKLPMLPVVVAGLIVVTGVTWYFWVKSDWNNAGTWGAIGDAVGPFAGLATALALGFAVYATMLQRKELELQRQEMRAQREEMRAQSEAAQQAATAQKELVKSQESLAKAQRDAVRAAHAATLAQHSATIAALTGTVTALRMEWGKIQNTSFENSFRKATLEMEGRLDDLLTAERRAYDQLAKVIATGKG